MITAPSLPPKAEKATCTACGLKAPRPIVLSAMRRDRHSGELLGRCSDRKACELRQRRAKAKAKTTERR